MIDKIVVEGPNNVGKSTFIDKLEHLLGFDWEVIHCTNNTPNTYDYFNKLFKSKRKIIFDRAHVGELVYPKLENRRARLSTRDFTKLLFHDNVLYIFVTAGMGFIEQAYKNKNEPFDAKYVMSEIYHFDKLYEKVKYVTDNVFKIHNEVR